MLGSLLSCPAPDPHLGYWKVTVVATWDVLHGCACLTCVCCCGRDWRSA